MEGNQLRPQNCPQAEKGGNSFVAMALSVSLCLCGHIMAAATQPTPDSYWPAPMTTRPSLSTPPPKGPYQPTWDSIREHYTTPDWFKDAKFGIFIHWGLYSIPAYHNEWYSKHMYGQFAQWHTEHYGPPDVFGYKDFIPMFKAAKYDPDQWAEMFKKAGARYVVPVAEHHDGFALWDSDITPWCAGKLGPKRDLIGELAAAVRKQGLVFGVSSHRMEHHTFMYPAAGVKNDQFDPRFRDFYGPPVPGNMNDSNASPQFQQDWLVRCQELVDKYHPQMFYFDNGVNARAYDSIKLRFAAYYYNRAYERNEQVSITTKDSAFLAGNIEDFEKVGSRSPKNIFPGYWQIDDPIGNTWGYTHDETFSSSAVVLGKLIDTVSKGGALMLNVSPNGDGVIVDPQPQRLLEIGRWLAANGEAIYGTRAWTKYGEGPSMANEGNRRFVAGDYRFTTKDGALYAVAMAWPGTQATIASLATGPKSSAKIQRVILLSSNQNLKFTQDSSGLKVEMPDQKPDETYSVLKFVLAP
jgi:alpha-L-fucosidase